MIDIVAVLLTQRSIDVCAVVAWRAQLWEWRVVM
jgi:hypothetical protein